MSGPSIKESAQGAAAAILDYLWEDRGFPVDPFEIAAKLGIHVEFAPLENGISGMILVEEGKTPQILIEVTDSPSRQRFTCAHEIGHFVERTDRIDAPREFAFVDRRGAEYDAHEYYADEFAGNLLMPEAEVQRLVDDQQHPLVMARHFGVSNPAMNVRLRILRNS